MNYHFIILVLILIIISNTYQKLTYMGQSDIFFMDHINKHIISYIHKTKEKIYDPRLIAIYKEIVDDGVVLKMINYRALYFIKFKDIKEEFKLNEVYVKVTQRDGYRADITNVELIENLDAITIHHSRYPFIMKKAIEALDDQLSIKMEYINAIEQYDELFIVYPELEDGSGNAILVMKYDEGGELKLVVCINS